jgi:dihydrofolate reductase
MTPVRIAEMVSSYEEAIEYANSRESDNISIIGGAQIYNLALQSRILDSIYLSIIESVVEGDAFFPWINPLHYKLYAIHDKGVKVVEYK